MEIQAVAKKRIDRTTRGGQFNRASAAFRIKKIEIGYEEEKALQDAYPDILNFYMEAPDCSISLEEFEKYALERLRLLRLIESVNSSSKVRYSQDYFYEIEGKIRKLDKSTYKNMFMSEEEQDSYIARKHDHIAHFLLRLAYARTDEQRKWFISLEMDFLRFKLNLMRKFDTSFLKKYNLHFTEINQAERKKFETEITNASYAFAAVMPPDVSIYKANFKDALDLVRSRKVFLFKGQAYIPQSDLSGVIAVKFRSHLSESMSLLKKNIHIIEEDERLRPLVFGFEKRYLGTDATVVKSGTAVSMAELDGFSQNSFPLCMKHLYDVVKKDHHLKHFGRLQLGLFFKGLGLPMDEATKYWRSNFTKRPDIDANRFDKQYLYNIRHMYGQEGKRTDYTPYSCLKIIHSSVGPGDHHGCPFKHSDATPLRVKLVDAGIPQDGVKDIMRLVDEKQYQLACQMYFELTHNKQTIEGGVHHPNQYFLESREVLTGKKTVKSEANAIKTTRTNIYKAGSQRSTQSHANDATQPEPMELDDADTMEDDEDNAMLSTMELNFSY